MPEPLSFRTGNTVSADDPVQIAGDTAVVSFSAAEAAAKNRQWELTTGQSAFLPTNLYRASVIVNCVAAATSRTQVIRDIYPVENCDPGSRMELPRSLGLVSTGAMEIAFGAGGSGTVIVTETSYV